MVEIASLSMGCPPRRSYILSIGRDLFGVPFVQREYGYTCGGKRSIRTTSVDSDEMADRMAKQLIKGAKRRGYEE